MVLSEIIIDSFVLLATILLTITVVSYILYKLKVRKKNNSNLHAAFIKPVDVSYNSSNQFVNAQLSDNINYYSYNEALNNHGKESELNNIRQQLNSTQELGKAVIKRKHYHFHKTTKSIGKISYR